MGPRKVERTIRCYKACGFIEEGRLRSHALRDGVWHDPVRMGVFASEFFYRSNLENEGTSGPIVVILPQIGHIEHWIHYQVLSIA